MKARAPLALTPADPQPQPHPARQGHHIPAILVAQPHVSAAPRAVLPGRHQDPLPLRPPPCRHPSHLAPPGVTDHCSYQRITPAAFAGLEFKPVLPSMLRGCSSIERLLPPTRTFAPTPTPAVRQRPEIGAPSERTSARQPAYVSSS